MRSSVLLWFRIQTRLWKHSGTKSALCCKRLADIPSNIKQRELNVIAQFPKHLIYDPDDPHDLPLPQAEPASHEKDLSDPQVETNIIPLRIFTRLTHLQNMFLLERLFLQNGAVDEGDVLLVSFEMISLTLLFWTHKDKFRDIRRDFEWMVSQHYTRRRIQLTSLVDGLCSSWWWHSLSRAPRTNLSRTTSKGQPFEPIEYCTEAELVGRIFGLGAPFSAEW